MKKNITINLCGRLFQIDEDAYDMLRHYTESLRSYFGRQQGGEEIADDIEERIAELFDELKQQGTEAITIDHVKDIITRIGKPEQLTDEDAESPKHTERQEADDSPKQKPTAKRLYRNPNDKMVAGVMSGLATYLGIEVTVLRFLAVVFTLCYGIGLILYIILAIILPQASTPEEQLKMQGKEVTPQNLADMVVENKQQTTHPQTNGAREVLSVLLKIVFGFFVGIAVVVGFMLGIGLLFAIVAVISALTFPISSDMPFSLETMGMAEIYEHNPLVLIIFTIALLVLLLIPFYAIIHMVLSLSKKIQPMGMPQRITLIVLWIVALCCIIPSGITMGYYHDEARTKDYQQRHIYQGVIMDSFDSRYLKKHGWTLLKHENCHNSYVNQGQYFLGNDKGYLDAWDDDYLLVYQAEKRDSVDAGYYRISCNARAEGEGVYIYATTPSSTNRPLAKVMIPAYGNIGGKIWEEARKQLEADSIPSERLQAIINANDGRGYGWSPVELYIRIEKPDTLCYGVSTDQQFTGEPCNSEWFSACDFKVEKVE